MAHPHLYIDCLWGPYRLDHIAFKILQRYLKVNALEEHKGDNIEAMKALLLVVFNDWDINGVGYIDKPTFIRVLNRLGLHFTTTQMNVIFSCIDPDRNGRVVFDEFWELIQRPILHAIEELLSQFEFQRQSEAPILMDTHRKLSKIYSSEGPELDDNETPKPGVIEEPHDNEFGMETNTKDQRKIEIENLITAHKFLTSEHSDVSSDEDNYVDKNPSSERLNTSTSVGASKTAFEISLKHSDEENHTETKAIANDSVKTSEPLAKNCTPPSHKERIKEVRPKMPQIRSFGMSDSLTLPGSFRKQNSEFNFETNLLGDYMANIDDIAAQVDGLEITDDTVPRSSRSYVTNHPRERTKESQSRLKTPSKSKRDKYGTSAATPRGSYKTLDDFFSAMTS